MPDLALWDLVAPYYLMANTAGNTHAALASLAVHEYEQADSPSASVVRGRAQVHGGVQLLFNPGTFSFNVVFTNVEGHPRNDPSRRDPWFDLRDTTIDFQLVAPHIGSAIITPAMLNAPLPVQNVFGPIPPADDPSTAFMLDLVVTSAVLRPPFLHPAKLEPDGTLAPDLDRQEVGLVLPKVKLRISQDFGGGGVTTIRLVSFGVTALDDPGAFGVAQMVTMDPPYAFIGSGRTVGFGFRSAVLDLSTASTPKAVLDQFGFDPGWTGVYFPEIRLFVAPQGAQGWAVSGGAKNLLVGFGASAGVTGDFMLDAVNQGLQPRLDARFYAPGGRPIPVNRNGDVGTVMLPPKATVIADPEGGVPPYDTWITIDSDKQPLISRDIDMSGTEKTIVVEAKPSNKDDAATQTLTITARRADVSGGTGTTTPTVPTGVPAASVKMQPAGSGDVNRPRLVIKSQTDSDVTVGLDDDSAATWTVEGTQSGPSRTVTFALDPGKTKQASAVVAGTPTKAPIYFHYDEPDQVKDDELDAYALNVTMTCSGESRDDVMAHGWASGVPIVASYEHYAAMKAVQALGPQAVVEIVGHASFEGDATKAEYNLLLSERRAKVARRLYALIVGDDDSLQLETNAQGFSGHQAALTNDDTSDDERRHWWRAELKNAVTLPGVTRTADVSRPLVPPPATKPVPVDQPPPASKRPDFLRSLGAVVRIIRDEFIAVELHGSIDVETATEQMLRNEPDANGTAPGANGFQENTLKFSNKADGVVAFRGVFTRNPGSDEWALDVLFGADPSDVNGLAVTGTLPGQPVKKLKDEAVAKRFARNLLGLYALFLPLMAKTSVEEPGSASPGDLALEVGAVAAPLALAAGSAFSQDPEKPLLNVERVMWWGAEVRVHQHGGEWSTSVLFDVETAVSANFLGLVTISRERPLVARYKAIGVRLGSSNGQAIFHPVFDSSKGYTLDMSKPGTLQVSPPLGQALRIDGAKIARTNPTVFDIGLAPAVDLGVVALERCGLRVQLTDPPSVDLTALGARVDIPGVLAGSGYLSITETSIAGRLDLTIVPVGLRISGALNIADIPKDKGGPATAVAVVLDVQFPVAIPLFGSGLGIYGLLGLFAMHFRRNESEDPKHQAKALQWLQAAKGDPTKIEDDTLWVPEIDHWAFGVGALVGTLGSPVVFNMKGVLLVELPGPRLLLMMKANLLAAMPKQKGLKEEGTLLAVIDVDAARGTLTIGIAIDYSIKPILELSIPAEAFFDGEHPNDWHIFLGQYNNQIRASIFKVFGGSGYLMLIGDGSQAELAPGLMPGPQGFAVSAGLNVPMVWGSKDLGLYAELAAGFDAVVGFSPLLVAGNIYARGELRLFIVSIAAGAKLFVELGEPPGQPDAGGYRISGEVCGSISLFFFDIEGCVEFGIEDGQLPELGIPTLVDGLTLVSRSPALVHGSGSDQPIDAGIGTAIEAPGQPAADTLPEVPINAIPVVLFNAPPLADGVTFRGNPLNRASGGRTVTRSLRAVTYTLTGVDLSAPALHKSLGNTKILGIDLLPDVSSGDLFPDYPAPATWWTLRPPNKANEGAELALLSWVPTPTPHALLASPGLDATIKDRWGTVCHRAAPAAPVLWTFLSEPLGRSAPGWSLKGKAWPDPPTTVRSKPPPTNMRVYERWRCGDPMVDRFREILPAEVVGAIVACPREDRPEDRPHEQPRPLVAAAELAMGAKRAESIDEPTITRAEMRRRLELGIPISRAALSQVVADPRLDPDARRGGKAITPGGHERSRCASRVLASPAYDTLAPPKADALHGDDIAKRWQLKGFDPGDLANAVELRLGAFDTARVLLFVLSRPPDGMIRVRAVTGEGTVVSEVAVEAYTALVTGTEVSLPPTWVDPAGPWSDDIALLMNHSELFRSSAIYPMLVDIKGHLKAESIVVGVMPEMFAYPMSYGVAAVEAVLAVESEREQADTHTVTDNHKALEAALGADSAKIPLMRPGEIYKVDVDWSATASGEGGESASDSKTQRFWFKTSPKPPDRLDPWVLACMPSEGERHVFANEPLKLAFSTHDVIALFAAYSSKLEVRLSAASSRHPEPAGAPNAYPPTLDGSTLEAVPVVVAGPWEDAVTRLVDPECVEIDDGRPGHLKGEFAIPLHPATDYLLDIWRVPSDDGADPEARVFRRAFATSQFASLAAFARFCLGSRVIHRAVPSELAGHIKAAFKNRQPEGAELDNALRGNAAQPYGGIEPMPVPDAPRIVVWWEQTPGTKPQPTAVVIDAPEPLWRSREAATLRQLQKTDIQSWELSRQDWVIPAEQPQPGSAGVVDQIVRAPGGQRAIAILKPGARGKQVTLVLHRKAFTESYLDGPGASDEYEPLAKVSLLRAPWEED
jgi:hypothetical protein